MCNGHRPLETSERPSRKYACPPVCPHVRTQGGGGGGVSTLIFRPVSERPFTVNGVSLASDDDPALNAGLVALSFLGDPDQYG